MDKLMYGKEVNRMPGGASVYVWHPRLTLFTSTKSVGNKD